MSKMPTIYETDNFLVKACEKPHVTRGDGGHVIIFPKQPVVNRWDLGIEQAKALMRLSMMAGEAMRDAMNRNGVFLERINFQDNGNWAIGTEQGPLFHLHLYGRARNAVHQIYGEALNFPLKATQFWTKLEQLTSDDCDLMKEKLIELSYEERYKIESWGIYEG